MRATELGPEPAAAARALLSAAAVRTRCHMVLEAARRGELRHFTLDEPRLDAAADYVAAVVRARYPAQAVPPHARWRHFVVGGIDRAAALATPPAGEPMALLRARFEIAITSVLLDAGAGPRWRWHDGVSGATLARSEGLAMASLAAFAAGLFSSDPRHPGQADATGLAGVDAGNLGAAFQVAPDNPLAGLDGRVALLRRLGAAIAAQPAHFAGTARLGGLADLLLAEAGGGTLAAPRILEVMLEVLGDIWPGRITLAGVALGDTWRHPAIDVDGPTRGLVPLHKLSQWLAYSLIEPLEAYGVRVGDIDGLTGLAEYRNGGLLLDLGVLGPRDPTLAARPHHPGSEPIVEWRALTVALIDAIAPRLRRRLGRSAAELPLAAILEGGTWAAGRQIARQLRADGAPPLTVLSDGSVF